MICQIIYGSRARGDHRHSSDVDLLGIVQSGPIRRTSPWRGVNLHLMPLTVLREKSTQGDLFVLHLVKEGKVIFDPSDLFELVKREFEFKDSYDHEKEQALAIMRFLGTPELLEQPSMRKRFVWAIRTLVIASAANARIPVFGAADLENWSGMKGFKKVVDRRKVVESEELIRLGQAVKEQFGMKLSSSIAHLSAEGLERHLISLGGICESTLKMVKPDQSLEIYDGSRPLYL